MYSESDNQDNYIVRQNMYIQLVQSVAIGINFNVISDCSNMVYVSVCKHTLMCEHEHDHAS